MRRHRAIQHARRATCRRRAVPKPVHAAAVGTQQARRAHEERALARARPADDRDDFRSPHVERDAAKRVNGSAAASEADAVPFVNAEESKGVGHGAR